MTALNLPIKLSYMIQKKATNKVKSKYHLCAWRRGTFKLKSRSFSSVLFMWPKIVLKTNHWMKNVLPNIKSCNPYISVGQKYLLVNVATWKCIAWIVSQKSAYNDCDVNFINTKNLCFSRTKLHYLFFNFFMEIKINLLK